MLLSKLTSSRQSSAASRHSGYAKAAACSVCYVPHQSTVRRIEAVSRSRHCWQCHRCLRLTDPKKREVLLHLSREKPKTSFPRSKQSIPILLYVHNSDLYDVATRGRFKATHGWASVDVKMRHPSEAPNKFTVLSTVLCPGASTIPFRLSLLRLL